MTVTITIECDNAAFSEYPEMEVVRILGTYVEKLERRGRRLAESDGVRLFDINGNWVGSVSVEGEEE